MRLTFLSRGIEVPSTARLVHEAKGKQHQVTVLNPVKMELVFDRGGAGLFFDRQRVEMPDVLIPRLAPSIATYGLAVVDQFGMRGVTVMNDARAIARSRNPMRCLQVLASMGLPIPPTHMVHEAADLARLSKSVGGFPLMVKILRGTEKHGTMVCESLKSLQAALQAVFGLGHDLVLQQYLKGGRIVRVMVLGKKAIAAVEMTKRRKKEKARPKATELTPLCAQTSVRAAEALALEFGVVELLELEDQVHILELNATPSIPEFEQATGLNLARRVVDHAEQLCKTVTE